MASKMCFVICPIGPRESEIRRRADLVLTELIEPAAWECGYRTTRADEIPEPGVIVPGVIDHLLNDPLVIADLTGNNANVFYELAIRHAARKPFVQILETGNSVPFNIAQMRMLWVDSEHRECLRESIQELKKHIGEAERLGRAITTPVTEYADIELLRTHQSARKLLPVVIFPTLVVRYSLGRFIKCTSNPVTRNFPISMRFPCNAQVTITSHIGKIRKHTHLSSLGHNAESHIGSIIWSSLGVEEGAQARPFRAVIESCPFGRSEKKCVFIRRFDGSGGG